jgi:3-dehydroquinate synthase
MITAVYNINGQKLKYYFEQSIKGVDSYNSRDKTIIITDENINKLYADFLKDRITIVLPAGESSKTFSMVEKIINQFIDLKVTKDFLIVGFGGGVVTDITGFVASIYMRGIPFAFMPTSLLAMVDAALGGKNGVNMQMQKNSIGTIQQPKWIIFDRTMLYTLPQNEWINGFAEIIKYGIILDKRLYELLQQHNLQDFQDKHYLTSKILYICTHIKTLIVEQDEKDNGKRKLLNFGHTIGHAIEKLEDLPHGFAISKGMIAALKISEEISGLSSTTKTEAIALFEKFGLPNTANFNKEKVFEILTLDKKREADFIHYITVNDIGKGNIEKISLVQLKDLFEKIL